MAVAHARHARRDDSSAFNSKEYYIINIPDTSNTQLSSGFNQNTGGAITLYQNFSSSSSENWQLFFQSGHYFIRNYDYGPMFQLGVTETSKQFPRLLPRSGSIGQQWTLSKVDGGWDIRNELWGPGFRFGLPRDSPLPSMQSDGEGQVWNITMNRSAAVLTPITGGMLSKVEDVEVRSSKPAATSSSASSTATNSINPTGSSSLGGSASTLPTSAPSSSPSSTSGAPATSSPSSSSSLSSGAIAGIAIGAVALLAAIVFAIWFFVKRKNTRQRSSHPHEMYDHGAEKYAYSAELPVPPAELAGREKDTTYHRVEMSSTRW